MGKKSNLTPAEIAELERGSEQIADGVDKVKAGLKDIKEGLFGKKGSK